MCWAEHSDTPGCIRVYNKLYFPTTTGRAAGSSPKVICQDVVIIVGHKLDVEVFFSDQLLPERKRSLRAFDCSAARSPRQRNFCRDIFGRTNVRRAFMAGFALYCPLKSSEYSAKVSTIVLSQTLMHISFVRRCIISV